MLLTSLRAIRYAAVPSTVFIAIYMVGMQNEDFDEDEGIYDELNLDEEEEKFGLANDDHDSDDSEDLSEGDCSLICS